MKDLVGSSFSPVSVITMLGFPTTYYNVTTTYPVLNNPTVSPSSVADAKGWQGISSVQVYNLALGCLEALWALLSSSVAILILEWLSESLLPISVMCVYKEDDLLQFSLSPAKADSTPGNYFSQCHPISPVDTLVSPLWQPLHRDNRMLVAN